MRKREMIAWVVVVVLLLMLAGIGFYYTFKVSPQLSDMATKDREVSDLKAANAFLSDEAKESAKKIAELEKAKNSLGEANATLTDQITKLVNEGKEIKKSEVYFARIYREGLTANEKLNKDNEALKAEIARLKKENEALTAEDKRLQGLYNQLLAEKAGSDAAKQAVEGNIADLNKQLETSRLEKEGLQKQLDAAKAALEVAEKRLEEAAKATVKAPTEDNIKETLSLKAEIKFLYSLILVATSSEENISKESRQKATNLMVRMTYQPNASIRFNAAKGVMESMPKDGAESVDLMWKAWTSWESVYQR